MAMRVGQVGLSSSQKTWVRDANPVARSRPEGVLPTPKMRVVVYTALFGEADRLWSVPPSTAKGIKYVVFTEKPRREVGLWTYSFGLERPVMLPGTEEMSSPTALWEQRIVKAPFNDRKSARYYKIMAHKALRGEADISIWVDANVRLLVHPLLAVKNWMSSSDLVVFKHTTRNCLFKEVQACLSLRKGNKDLVASQARAYKKAGMPRDRGLASTRCLVRRHTSKVAKLNESWWREIRAHSLRDQISLPFVCWRDKLQWKMIPGGVRFNKDFWFIWHRGVIE